MGCSSEGQNRGREGISENRAVWYFPLGCPLILEDQDIRIPYNMILRSNYECNENIFPLFTDNYD